MRRVIFHWCLVGMSCAVTGQFAFAAEINVPDDFATIQQAIDAASIGDTITIQPGTYSENLLIDAKAVTLIGQSGAAQTIITAQDAAQPVLALFATDTSGVVTIQGLTLTGGRGGVDIFAADVVLRDCVVHENHEAPGLDVYWSTLTIENTAIARNGGSAVSGGGIGAFLSVLHVRDTTIQDNRGGTGGGMFLGESDGSLDGVTFVNNEGEDGGGLFLGLATITINNTDFDSNVALNSGGAIHSTEIFGSMLAIHDTSIYSNSAAEGGGIWIGKDFMVEIERTTFCHNNAAHITGRWVDLGGNTFADQCPAGDLNGDGQVDVADLTELMAMWGPCTTPQSCPGDLNGDGVVDVADMLILLSSWQ